MKPLPPTLLIAVLLFRLSFSSSFLPKEINTLVVSMNQSPRSVVPAESHCHSAAIGNGPIKMASTYNNDNDSNTIEHPRSLVFEIAALIGELSSLFLTRVPLDPPLEPLPSASHNASDKKASDNDKEQTKEEFVISRPTTVAIEDSEVANTMGRVLLKLLQVSHALDLKLAALIRTKMALNNKKYPAALCRGKAGKYTTYSAVTGITKDVGQSTLDVQDTGKFEPKTKESVQDFLASLEQATSDIGDFATERLWYRYHKPRNLLLALLGELGEVSE